MYSVQVGTKVGRLSEWTREVGEVRCPLVALVKHIRRSRFRAVRVWFLSP